MVTDPSQKIPWQIGQVVQIKQETPRTKSFLIQLPNWREHWAGQHYNLRLTAEDGYQAMRSYSVASSPSVRDHVELTIDLVPEGEVSPYMHEVIVEGDEVELRGPIGGYFVWKPDLEKRVLLIGGGSGIVPLMSILRSQSGAHSVKLLYSNQSPELTIYKEELDRLGSVDWFDLEYTFTREKPEHWEGYSRRVDHDMVMDFIGGCALGECIAYLCGPTPFVEFVANTLRAQGMHGSFIRTERFGPTD